jgi:ADP-heptose:LPS heptosyltransferase
VKILVVKLSSLGDLFHALPAAHNLKAGLGAEIHWVANAEFGELVGCFSDVSRFVPFPRRSFLGNLRPFLRDLRRERYDYIVDFQGLLKSAMVALAARGRTRIGPSFCREGTRALYGAVAGPRNRDRHMVEQILDIAGYLGLKRLPPRFPVSFPPRPVAAGRPAIALAPVSRWPSKNWPAPCFIDAARRVLAVRGGSVHILGGPADQETCGRIADGIGAQAVSLAGRLGLAETGGLLAGMDLVIGNDSGPIHMAAAVGAPVLGVFGPTDAARTGPYGEGHRVAAAALPCRPCFSRTCRREGIPCLQGVTPEHVAEMAIDMLRRAPRGRA